jgi:hypothetical protein
MHPSVSQQELPHARIDVEPLARSASVAWRLGLNSLLEPNYTCRLQL